MLIARSRPTRVRSGNQHMLPESFVSMVTTPGRIVIADMRFRTLLSVLLSLFHHEIRDKDETKTLKAAFDECEKIAERRQRIGRFRSVHQRGWTNRRAQNANQRVKAVCRRVEKEELEATLDLSIRRCQEAFSRLAAVMDGRSPGWLSPEDPTD
jgi:hypothetical protein